MVCYSTQITETSILKILKNSEILKIEDSTHKELGLFLNKELADEFFKYIEKKQLLESAKKIKTQSLKENLELEGSIDDGI